MNRSKDIFKLQDFITSPALNFELEFHEILRLLCSFTWLDTGSWAWAWKYQSQNTQHNVLYVFFFFFFTFCIHVMFHLATSRDWHVKKTKNIRLCRWHRGKRLAENNNYYRYTRQQQKAFNCEWNRSVRGTERRLRKLQKNDQICCFSQTLCRACNPSKYSLGLISYTGLLCIASLQTAGESCL